MRSISAILIPFIIMATCALNVKAQQYPVKHYTMRDGLLHSIVYSTYQDKQGFIWFCTERGLSRFDGKIFKNYTTKNGLSHSAVLSITENEKDEKLISVYRGGIDIMKDGKITHLKTAGEMGKWVIRNIPSNKNTLWIVTRENEKQLQLIKNGIIKTISSPVNWKNTFLNEAYNFKGEILFASTKGIYKVVNDTTIEPYLQEITKGRNVANIAWKSAKEYWLSCDNELIHCLNGSIIKKYEIACTTSDILLGNNNDVWLALNNGELLLVKNDSVLSFTDKLPIPKVIITDLFQDKEGNIWFTTQGLGVFCLTSLNIREYPARTGQLNNFANCLEKAQDGSIWIGSFGTISRWKDGIVKEVASTLLPSEFIYFVKAVDNDIYVGTPYRLIRKQTTFPYKETIITNAVGAISICTNSKKEIFFGSFNNLYKLNENTISKLDTAGILNGSRCNSCAFDKHNILWVATDSGIAKYQDGKLSYPKIPKLKWPYKVNQLFTDADRRLWIATDSGLIYESKEKLILLTKKDGLADNSCNALYADENRKLWIGTENGISVIDLNSFSIKEYITGVDFSELRSILRTGQDLFLSTIEGLTVIDASRTENQESIPTLYITSATTALGDFYMPSSLTFPYQNNKLIVEFSGLSFRYADRIEYRYRMNGLDENWHYTKNNAIEFSAIPSGEYSFQVEVRSGKGTWGNLRTLNIKVQKPYWRTWWFISIVIILITSGTYLLLKHLLLEKEKTKRKKLLALNKIAYLKQQALSALINPHFIFNCMNSIQNYLNKKDHDQANKYLADFAKLIRMTMEHAQESFISLDKEIERIKLYFTLEKLRFGNKLSYTIDIDSTIKPIQLRIPNMILQPFIENAIWHGIMPKKGGNIKLIFENINDNQISIVVEDDGVGVGIGKAKRPGHRSFGIDLIRNRLKLLSELLNENYSCTISTIEKNGSISGTKVIILLPLKPTEQDLLNLEQLVHAIEDNQN